MASSKPSPHSKSPKSNLGTSSSSSKCADCGSNVDELLRHCKTCGADLGCPNVRAAQKPEQCAALAERFSQAGQSASARGVKQQFDSFTDEVKKNSHVVVSMRPFAARNFLQDPREIYSNYERLVGAGCRTPASFVNDTNRSSVSGKLFGTTANEILYGVLSLNGWGLPSYGSVFLKLRDIAIKNRVTFLHENSYFFLQDQTFSKAIPLGFTSSWENRNQLAATKIEPQLSQTDTQESIKKYILTQGTSREGDRCIEAHIFGTFNGEAIQSVEFIEKGANRSDRNDIDTIKALMKKRAQTGGTP